MGFGDLSFQMPVGGEELVDRLSQAENAVAWFCVVLLAPVTALAIPRLDLFTAIAAAGLLVAVDGVNRRIRGLFLAGAGLCLVLAPIVVQGPLVMLVVTLAIFSVMAGDRTVRLLRGNRDHVGEHTERLARNYLASIGWLGFELMIGAAVALMVVVVSPLWRYPSWTAVELGLVMGASLILIVYWLMRTANDAQKG